MRVVDIVVLPRSDKQNGLFDALGTGSSHQSDAASGVGGEDQSVGRHLCLLRLSVLCPVVRFVGVRRIRFDPLSSLLPARQVVIQLRVVPKDPPCVLVGFGDGGGFVSEFGHNITEDPLTKRHLPLVELFPAVDGRLFVEFVGIIVFERRVRMPTLT